MANYSSQDFKSVYEDLLSFVESSTTAWNPRNSTEADPGVVILKLIAMLEDKHNYRFDMARNQNYLDGVSDQQSAYELLKMLGYLMKRPRAATGEVHIEALPEAFADADGNPAGIVISLPLFTQITDATKTLKFFITDDYIISNSDTTKIVKVQAGEPFQVVKDGNDFFTLKDIDEQGRLYLGKSNLAQNGVFILTRQDKEDDSKTLLKDWGYIDYAILKPREKWYMVETAENGEVYIQFPENFEELVGSSKLEVWATYTTGSATNITKNMLSRFEDTEAYPTSQFIITQPNNFYDGQDEESIDLAVKHYYETKDVCNTLVTASDFEAAIKNMLAVNIPMSFTDAVKASNVADDNKIIQGKKYFSNAVVKTVQDRRLKVRSSCNGKEYTRFQKTNSEDNNRIDVIAFHNNSDYTKSFKRVTDSTFIEAFESDAQQQFIDNRTIDVDVKIDTTSPTILAVTTPDITIRVANSSSTSAAQLKQKIRDYFYTTYKMDVLTAGQPLNYQKIIDDIKSLSPDILSVSMQELKYDTYLDYAPVSGSKTSKRVEDDKNSSNSVYKSSIAKSVLAGDVPLFRYYNRQNTLTKRALNLSLSASQSNSVAVDESVVHIPWNVESFKPIKDKVDDKDVYFINPLITKLTPISSSFADGDMRTFFKVNSTILGQAGLTDPTVIEKHKYKDLFGVTLVSDNQLLQARRPLNRTDATYGFGMQYKFVQTKPISGAQSGKMTLAAGSFLANNSKLKLEAGYSIEPSSSFTTGTDGVITISTSGSGVILSKAVSATNLSFATGSYLLPGSTSYDPAVPADGVEYQLKVGETLTIAKSSTGSIVANFKAGDFIMTSGLTLLSADKVNSNNGYIVLNTSQSIAKLVADKSTISTNFKYFLALKNVRDITLSKTSSYMLEEGEFLLYSDKAVTEYVTLGPGTILSLDKESKDTEVILKGSAIASLSNIETTQFNDVPGLLSAQSNEFTTFSKGAIIFFEPLNTADTSIDVNKDFPIKWVPVSRIYIYSEGNVMDILRDLSKDSPEISPDFSFESFDSNIQFRLVVTLSSNSDGLTEITAPVSLTVGGEALAPLEDAKSYLSTTVPISDVLTESNVPLFAKNVTARCCVSSQLSGPSVSGGLTADFYSDSVKLTVPSTDVSECKFSIVMPRIITTNNTKPCLVMFDVAFSTPPTKGTFTVTSKVNTEEVSANFSLATVSNIWHYLTAEAGEDLNIPLSEHSFGFTVFALPKTIEGSKLDKGFNIAFNLDSSAVEALKGQTITLYNLSYITDYSTEVKCTEGLGQFTDVFEGHSSNDFALLQYIISLDKEKRFNYLCTPSESFVSPTSPNSFFEKGHPYNSVTFPYIEIDDAKIRIISDRR